MKMDRAKPIYTNGTYLDLVGASWHLEDASFKAAQILRMLRMHPEVKTQTVCDIGCGAGAVIGELFSSGLTASQFTGYEISPQAHAISSRFANESCRFVLGSAFEDEKQFELVLVMDVIEHVEDCFDFLRRVKKKGRWKLCHIPIDCSVSAILRGHNAWHSVGHIHLFTVETALETLRATDHQVIDWFLTDGALALGSRHPIRRALANLFRRPLGVVSKRLAARLLGGYSVLALTE